MERNHKRQDDTADTGRGYVYIRVYTCNKDTLQKVKEVLNK